MIQGSRATPSRPFSTQVFVRVLFLKMGEIQTIKERYSAEVYVESRWREPTLDDLTDEQVSEGVWERQKDTGRQTHRQIWRPSIGGIG